MNGTTTFGHVPMTDVAATLRAAAAQASGLYHRLVLLVGHPGAGKTAALGELARSANLPVVNLNLALSRALLDVPRAQRRLAVPRLLGGIVESLTGEAVLLDNIEIVFAPELQLDPLKALQQLSRNRTIVAAWNGRAEGDRLLYAEPSHSEFRDYPVRGLMIVTLPARLGAAMA
jgi:hypothetical protein